MMDIIYTVLYTHQKTKKAKTWQDGTLKVLATGTKAILYDEKGSKLDALHIHASDVITGEQLESDRYYIQVEEVQKRSRSQPELPAARRADSASNSHDSTAHARTDNSYSQASSTLNASLKDHCARGGSGLKRKRSGFIPPRLVRARPADDEERASDVLATRFYGYGIGEATSCSPSPEMGLHRSGKPPQGFHSNFIGGSRQTETSSTTLFGAVSAVPDDVSCERNPSSATLLVERGGRSPAGEVLQTVSSRGSLLSPGSPRLQTSVMKNIPWRTIGSASANASPLLRSHPPGGAITTGGKGHSTGEELKSTHSQNAEETSPPSSHSPAYASVFQQGPPMVQNSYPENLARPLKEPVVKRSASEIMALLGKKKSEVTVKTISSKDTSTSLVSRKPAYQSGNSGQLQSTVASGSFNMEERSEFSPLRTDLHGCVSSPQNTHLSRIPADKVIERSCLSHTQKSHESSITEYSVSHSHSAENIRNSATPELSVSISSLSKHDFEEEDDCFKHSACSELEYSQSLSDFDCPEVQKSASEYENTAEVVPDCFLDPEGSEKSLVSKRQSPSDVVDELGAYYGSLPAPEHPGRDETMNTSRCSEEVSTLQAQPEANLSGDLEIQVIEKDEEDDIAACFEMSLSPLSEEAEFGGDDDDEKVGPNCDMEEIRDSSHIQQAEEPDRKSSLDSYNIRKSPESSTSKSPAGTEQLSVKPTGNVDSVDHVIMNNGSPAETGVPDSAESQSEESDVAQAIDLGKECDTVALITGGSATVTDFCLEEKGGCYSNEEPVVEVNKQSDTDAHKGDNNAHSSVATEDNHASQTNRLEGIVEHTYLNIVENNSQNEYPTDINAAQLRLPSATCTDKLQCISEDMKTLDDIDISPDPFSTGHSSQQNCQEVHHGILVPKGEATSPADGTKHEQWHRDVDMAITNVHNVSDVKLQNQTGNEMQQDCNEMTKKEYRYQVENRGITAFPGSCKFPPELMDTKVSTLSPASFTVPDCSQSPDSLAREDSEFTLGRMISPMSSRTVKDNICLPVAYRRHVRSDNVKSKIPRLDSSSYHTEHPLSACPQNTPDWSDHGPNYPLASDQLFASSSSPPVHRIFQTVSEVLGESKRSPSPSVDSSGDGKEHTSMLEERMQHSRWQAGNGVSEAPLVSGRAGLH